MSSWAQADPVPTKPTTTTLVGQCRAVNKRTPIYSNRNPVSAVVMLLEQITR
ncbi:MAG: hypothetical protein HC805_01925 [Alkalinema sp. RL_2_19]|nr:hypothetical protein [Alkalinema sp. RL_2_19]